ncbi:hypothetical protein [Rhizobacter sp. LjRoot28]|uniref:hypothetical protein n=1 Tax=Rhizobacter sp. LjRoot28 TaxID=3342309 RepID=UPI003ECF9622
MSTTFEVYPRTTVAPSFAEVLDLGTRRVQQHLLARGVRATPELGVTVQGNGTHQMVPIDVSRPAIWDSSEYAWFFVDGVAGGTDVSYMSISTDDLDYWKSVLEEHGPARKRKGEILACLSSGSYWSFRRSTGQPAVINFAYGILAAVFAELTNGFVFSDDSAWDYERFPATADEMYEWYFDPEKTSDPGKADWARACLAAIAEEGCA